jgi:predicted nucleic acid-binding protein
MSLVPRKRSGEYAMPEPRRMIYWDSCIFLHWLEGTKRWQSALDAIIDEVKDTASLVLVTSTASITEVAYAKVEKSEGLLDPAVLVSLDDLWADDSIVRLIEFDQLTARRARDLLRRSIETPRSLKPLDAIHLATALQMGVEDCHTTDARMKSWNDLGFPVRDPWTAKPRLPGV